MIPFYLATVIMPVDEGILTVELVSVLWYAVLILGLLVMLGCAAWVVVYSAHLAATAHRNHLAISDRHRMRHARDDVRRHRASKDDVQPVSPAHDRFQAAALREFQPRIPHVFDSDRTEWV